MISEENFAEAFTKYHRRTQLLLTRSGVQADVAEDLAQGAWLRAWEKRDQYRGQATVAVWVQAIARRAYIVLIRAKRWSDELPLTHDQGDEGQFEKQIADRVLSEELLRRLPIGQSNDVVDHNVVALAYGQAPIAPRSA